MSNKIENNINQDKYKKNQRIRIVLNMIDMKIGGWNWKRISILLIILNKIIVIKKPRTKSEWKQIKGLFWKVIGANTQIEGVKRREKEGYQHQTIGYLATPPP